MAAPVQAPSAQAVPPATGEGPPVLVPADKAAPPTPAPVQPKRAAHYQWAVLIARIYEVVPVLCSMCGGQMRIIAFITHSADIRKILDYIGVESEPPHIPPARGPPLWDDGGDAQMDDGCKPSRIRMGRHNQHRTMRSISASIGEGSKQ